MEKDGRRPSCLISKNKSNTWKYFPPKRKPSGYIAAFLIRAMESHVSEENF